MHVFVGVCSVSLYVNADYWYHSGPREGKEGRKGNERKNCNWKRKGSCREIRECYFCDGPS